MVNRGAFLPFLAIAGDGNDGNTLFPLTLRICEMIAALLPSENDRSHHHE
jgi:hypothetical protein